MPNRPDHHDFVTRVNGHCEDCRRSVVQMQLLLTRGLRVSVGRHTSVAFVLLHADL